MVERMAQRGSGESLSLYRELFDRVPIGLYRTTPGGEVVDVNAALLRMLGYADKSQLLAAPAARVYADPEARRRWSREMDERGTVSGFEVQWRRRDGAIIWVEENAYAVRGKDGSILHYEGSAEDITARRSTQARLAEEQARFEQLFSASPEAIVLCDNAGSVLRANAAFFQLFGYAPHEVEGRSIDDLVTSKGNGFHDEALGITQQIAEGQLSFVETQRRRKDGRLIHVSILGKPILLDGRQIAIYGIYRDISAQKEAEEALAESRRKIEELHEAADALGAAANEEAIYRTTCEAAERVLGFSLAVLCIVDGNEFACQAVTSKTEVATLGRMPINPSGIPARALSSEQPILVADPTPEILPPGMPASIRSLICAPIGELGVLQAGSPEPGAFTAEDGRLLSILLRHTAVAALRLRLQGQLIRQARHDALTGVYNRHYFNEFIAQEVLRSSRYEHPIGLLMIDVNRFKEINDHYGHQTGDAVLCEIASVLKRTVRATDMVVRYGGDEFLVVLTETGESTDRAAHRVRAAVRQSEKLREISGFDVTVSVGSIFWHPDAGTPIEEALATADALMYADKRGERDRN